MTCGDAAQAACPGHAPGGARRSSRSGEPCFPIGYVELTDDARYDEDYAYAQCRCGRSAGRSGAELGIADGQQIGKVIGSSSSSSEAGGSVEELAETVEGGPARACTSCSRICRPSAPAARGPLPGPPELLLNATAPDDRLRAPDCRANSRTFFRATPC